MDGAEGIDPVLQWHSFLSRRASWLKHGPHDIARPSLFMSAGFSMRVLVVQNYDNTGLGQVG
ncbi:MAG: GMP synthase, partial [Mesorhizobium sp.]